MKQKNALSRNFKKSGSIRGGKFGFAKCLFAYLTGGLAGTLYETVLNLVRGDGFVYCNGSLFTPFNYVYGIGAVAIILALRGRTSKAEVFCLGTIVGGAVEYLLSFLEENILGTRSWDYSDEILNINGRTSIPIMIGWGILCVCVIFLAYKPLNRLLDGVPDNIMKKVAIIFFVIILMDFIITVAVIARYALRNSDVEAFTAIGRLIDGIFTDEFMQLHFPKMLFS